MKDLHAGRRQKEWDMADTCYSQGDKLSIGPIPGVWRVVAGPTPAFSHPSIPQPLTPSTLQVRHVIVHRLSPLPSDHQHRHSLCRRFTASIIVDGTVSGRGVQWESRDLVCVVALAYLSDTWLMCWPPVVSLGASLPLSFFNSSRSFRRPQLVFRLNIFLFDFYLSIILLIYITELFYCYGLVNYSLLF